MKKFWISLLVGIIWIGLQIGLAVRESPTFDEPIHVKAGWDYLKGNYDFDPIEPPLLRKLVVWPTSLGLVAQNDLNYINYRLVVIALGGVMVGWIVYLTQKIENNRAACLLSLLILLEPNILTHGHYVTTDWVSSGLAILTIVYWMHFPVSIWSVLLPALAVATKASMMVYLAIAWLLVYRKKLPELIVVSAMVIWASYGFLFQPILSDTRVHETAEKYTKFTQELGKIKLPMGGYLQAIKENYQFSRRGLSVYFAGEIYEKAPWWKQIIVLILKVPWPVWMMATCSLILLKVDRRYLWLFGGWTGLNMVGNLHLGIRHELVLVWLLLLMGARVAKYWWSFLLVAVMLLLMLGNWPQMMTYTNSNNAMWWHSDADYDWGQGLIELKKEVDRRGIYDLQFAYFGNVEPACYGIDYERIKDANAVGQKEIQNVDFGKTIIISVTCWQTCGYAKDERFKDKKIEKIAGSFLLVK